MTDEFKYAEKGWKNSVEVFYCKNFWISKFPNGNISIKKYRGPTKPDVIRCREKELISLRKALEQYFKKKDVPPTDQDQPREEPKYRL